jgi:hypothetical protein
LFALPGRRFDRRLRGAFACARLKYGEDLSAA